MATSKLVKANLSHTHTLSVARTLSKQEHNNVFECVCIFLSVCPGSSEHSLAREKAARSVTLTVIVVSLTFLILTLPVSAFYVLSYVAKEYNEVKGHEYAKLYFFYTLCYLLAMSNSAVNFYLYCLTGRRFREEFLQIMLCWKREKEKHGGTEHSTAVTAVR